VAAGGKGAPAGEAADYRFDLVVNLITAKALGLKIPESFRVRAQR
jgi:hypothetical protein